MTTHFFKEIDKLKKQVLSLAATVEERLNLAVKAIEERDTDLARQVIDGDPEVDELEVEVEEESLKILTLHQPVAMDLRFLVSVLKINNDLERIGDLAVNIAERALALSAHPETGVPLDFGLMTEKVRAMLKSALDAFVELDAEIARRTLQQDDEVDAMNREMYDIVKQDIRKDPTPERVDVLIHLLSVSRCLERIADHATNIAEDMIYMMEGRIVRHRPERETEGGEQGSGN